MARPLRIEYNGALQHVLSRGNAGEHIFKDPKDRLAFLYIIADASYDLSQSLAMPGRIDDPAVIEKMEKVVLKAAQERDRCWHLCRYTG
ncbi:MAG: hypothetical protein JRI77_15350 [Deltaproteobacteria bacterium]|nr:hypothetical protein [Deltaproteobacteria bacterium]